MVEIPFKKFLYPNRDPGHHQNLTVCCYSHIPTLKNHQKLSTTFVNKLADKHAIQTPLRW